jgi:protein-disulfide isomerase
MIGNDSATVTLLEFVDYECPVCRVADSILQRNAASLSVRIRVLQFPLSIHPGALAASLAAVCVEEAGNFATFHHAMFRGAGAVSNMTTLWHRARDAGVLDSASFERCVAAESTLQRVEADIELGHRLGVAGTPTFVAKDGSRRGIDYLIQLSNRSDVVGRR